MSLTVARLANLCGVPTRRVYEARRFGLAHSAIFERYRVRPRHMATAVLGRHERRTRVEVLWIHSPFTVRQTNSIKGLLQVWLARVRVAGEDEPRDIALERLA